MSKKFNKNNKDQQILKKIFYTYIDNYFFHLDLNNDYRIFSEVVALNDISASDLLSERYNSQTDYSKSFYIILANFFIYYESTSNNYHYENLNMYNEDTKMHYWTFFLTTI